MPSKNTKILVSHRYNLDDINKAYIELDNQESLGIIIKYDDKDIDINKSRKVQVNKNISKESSVDKKNINVSFIGSGNYASRFLMPIFKQNKTKEKS